MNPYQAPFGQNAQQSQYGNYQQIQQMFPQPQGSVYSINAPIEIGNVPIGSTGLSVAICFPESLMYIKSFQNGNPVLMAYRIAPYTKDEEATPKTVEKDVAENELEQRLARIEQTLNSLKEQNGGKFNGLL